MKLKPCLIFLTSYVTLLLIILNFAETASISSNNQYVNHNPNPLFLIISFDGFRWDYLKNNYLKNFEYLKSHGSHADYIKNAFATFTFPNHWSLVTGLYEETHGILANHMYDPVLNKEFHLSPGIEWYGQNPITEPIWSRNQRFSYSRRSAVSAWPGGDVTFSGQNVTYFPYKSNADFYESANQLIDLFLDKDRPINFGALYFDEPDTTGHKFGPYSKEMKAKLAELNTLLGYIIDRLTKYGLFDRLNLIITSDHGMEEVTSNRIIVLDDHVDISLFKAFGSKAAYNLFLNNQSDLNNVYEKLKRIEFLDVYLKEDIPEKYHYKRNVRVGDILIVANLGYGIYFAKDLDKLQKGEHGYYNTEKSMYPIFIAHGPAFKKNFHLQPFNSVDIYPLMCKLLNIPQGRNNGTLSIIKQMLI